jgi:hypothetical protein
MNPRKESQQHEVTMPKEDKNQNGKRNNETKIIGKKDRNLGKKRAKVKKLQNRRNFVEGKFAKLELRRDIRITLHGTFPWRRDIVV